MPRRSPEVAPTSSAAGARVVLAYGVLAVVAIPLVAQFFRALAPAVERSRGDACLSLDPQPQGQPAHDFELADARGEKLRLSSLRGRVVLLNFWATWCPPCVEEMPSLERLARALPGKPFDLVAVSVDDSWDIVQKFFAQRGQPSYRVLLDTPRATPGRYGTEKFPESYLIDAQGTVRYRFINLRDWSAASAVECIESVLPGTG